MNLSTKEPWFGQMLTSFFRHCPERFSFLFFSLLYQMNKLESLAVFKLTYLIILPEEFFPLYFLRNDNQKLYVAHKLL